MWLGHNIKTSYGILTVIDRAVETGANCFQIFLSSPHSFKSNVLSDTLLKQFRDRVEEHNMKFVVHASFMLNFCHPPKSYIHKGATELLIKDVNQCAVIGSIGAIVHMGNNVKKLGISEEEAIQNYVLGIQNVLANTDPKGNIILETGAGCGTEVCTSIPNLGKLLKRFTKKERDRLSVCIDTCHIFAAGYNIGDPDYVPIFENLIEMHIGWNNVSCIHLNSSKDKLRSRKDHHEAIGFGYINLDGLRKFIDVCVKREKPMILETPYIGEYDHIKQMEVIKSWYASDEIH